MEDIFFVAKCNHRIQNYTLDLYESNGTYRAKFPCPVITDKALTYIRKWDDEQQYIREHTIDNIQPRIITTKHKSGANAVIGIDSYNFISDREIEFETGTLDISGIIPPILVVDFTAMPNVCARCGGSGIVKDITIDKLGKVVTITGKDKIKQKIIKALMTPIGTSPFDATYGSELYNVVGTSITDETRILLQKFIMNCLEHLIKDQTVDLTAEERIKVLKGITLKVINDPNKLNAQVLLVKVVVLNAANEEIDCSINFDLG